MHAKTNIMFIYLEIVSFFSSIVRSNIFLHSSLLLFYYSSLANRLMLLVFLLLFSILQFSICLFRFNDTFYWIIHRLEYTKALDSRLHWNKHTHSPKWTRVTFIYTCLNMNVWKCSNSVCLVEKKQPTKL